jgi:hypothetical protein
MIHLIPFTVNMSSVETGSICIRKGHFAFSVVRLCAEVKTSHASVESNSMQNHPYLCRSGWRFAVKCVEACEFCASIRGQIFPKAATAPVACVDWQCRRCCREAPKCLSGRSCKLSGRWLAPKAVPVVAGQASRFAGNHALTAPAVTRTTAASGGRSVQACTCAQIGVESSSPQAVNPGGGCRLRKPPFVL